jgi:hypothetical protein
LLSSDSAAASAADGSTLSLERMAPHGFGVVDAPPVGELRAENRPAKLLAPLIDQSDQRDPRGEHAVLRKRLGPAHRRQGKPGANPFQVAPHVAALGGEKVEGGGGPALRLEDRPQQERPELDLDADRARQRAHAHRRRIVIGRGEVEPEIEGRRGHGAPF